MRQCRVQFAEYRIADTCRHATDDARDHTAGCISLLLQRLKVIQYFLCDFFVGAGYR